METPPLRLMRKRQIKDRRITKPAFRVGGCLWKQLPLVTAPLKNVKSLLFLKKTFVHMAASLPPPTGLECALQHVVGHCTYIVFSKGFTANSDIINGAGETKRGHFYF